MVTGEGSEIETWNGYTAGHHESRHTWIRKSQVSDILQLNDDHVTSDTDLRNKGKVSDFEQNRKETWTLDVGA